MYESLIFLKSLDKVFLSTYQLLLNKFRNNRRREHALLWIDNWLKKVTIRNKKNQFSAVIKKPEDYQV